MVSTISFNWTSLALVRKKRNILLFALTFGIVAMTSSGLTSAQATLANTRDLLRKVEVGWDELRVRDLLGEDHRVLKGPAIAIDRMPAAYVWGYGASNERSFPIYGFVGFNANRKVSIVLHGLADSSFLESIDHDKLGEFYYQLYNQPVVTLETFDPRAAVRAANVARTFGKQEAKSAIIYFDSMWPYNTVFVAAVVSALFQREQPSAANNLKISEQVLNQYCPFVSYRGWPIMTNDGQTQISIPYLLGAVSESAEFITRTTGSPPKNPDDFVLGCQTTPGWNNFNVLNRYKDYQKMILVSQVHRIYSFRPEAIEIVPSLIDEEKKIANDIWERLKADIAKESTVWDDAKVEMVASGDGKVFKE